MSHWHKLLLVLLLDVGLAGNAYAREGGHSDHHGILIEVLKQSTTS
jgi:hypothetical protein